MGLGEGEVVGIYGAWPGLAFHVYQQLHDGSMFFISDFSI